ncbi:hypothetical protein [Nocardia fluminea]|uniref:hypothetical protein n=1 Tax=Nocardia fluminea TaxID=134984 RepID=UPI0036640577
MTPTPPPERTAATPATARRQTLDAGLPRAAVAVDRCWQSQSPIGYQNYQQDPQ